MKSSPFFALLSAVAALTPTLCAAQTPPTSNRPQPHRLTVSGHADIKATPDEATISVGVVTDDKSAVAAARDNALAATRVRDAVASLGVAEKDIQTSNYSVQPLTTGGFNNEPQRITGYRVSNDVLVTVRKLTTLGPILDGVTSAGSNSVNGISFRVAHPDVQHDAAIAAAIKDARRQADVACTAGNLHVVATLDVNISSVSRPQPMYFASRAMAGMAAAPSTPVEPGQVTITADVTIVYQIADGEVR
ncbi:MAG: SIMPL domain-containing protein [Armatimonadetes bacterium]|nr:SIMPL domain-containing protein [Armatimonadota bacterium]MDE2207971.1 SIMPL domain-containing protein [Armatimonadota bacterium]